MYNHILSTYCSFLFLNRDRIRGGLISHRHVYKAESAIQVSPRLSFVHWTLVALTKRLGGAVKWHWGLA